jgi:hypothetical protein
MDVLEDAYNYAEHFALDVPPAEPQTLALKVAMTLAPHEHSLVRLGRAQRARVIRRTTVRIAAHRREAAFARSDQYHYWTDEVAWLLTMAAEAQALHGALHVARMARFWGIELDELGPPGEAAAPAFTYRSFRTDIWDRIADVLRCLPQLSPSEREVLRYKHFTLKPRGPSAECRAYRPAIRSLCALMNGAASRR